jgi:hypothetical protein
MNQSKSEALIADLRTLATSDPKRARTNFVDLLVESPSDAEEVLLYASKAGEGRLRQTIATVFRTTPTATSLRPWLERWRDIESDEFTRAAIENALGGQKRDAPRRVAAVNTLMHEAEAYRYISDRLCHRVRNALPLPTAHLRRLEQLAETTDDESLKGFLSEIVAGLRVGIRRIARNVDFDTGDNYLKWESIAVIPWLETAAPNLSARFGHAQLTVTGDVAARTTKIRATRFLLDTLFGNVWSNSVQAVEPIPCALLVECSVDNKANTFSAMIVDNGHGFDRSDIENAFNLEFSSKGLSRGRGLLEIAEAVTRMEGRAEIVPARDLEYRLQINLPIDSI